MSECSVLVYLEMDVTPFSRLSPIIGHARAQLQTTFNVLTRATRLMFCTNHPAWTTTSLVILKTPCAGLSCFVTIYRRRLVRYKQTTSMLMPKCRFLMTPMLAHSLVMLFHPCIYTCMTSIHGVMLLTYPTMVTYPGTSLTNVYSHCNVIIYQNRNSAFCQCLSALEARSATNGNA